MIGRQDEGRVNNRPAKQLWLPFEIKGELFTSKSDTVSPVGDEQLMERVVDREKVDSFSMVLKALSMDQFSAEAKRLGRIQSQLTAGW